MDSRKLLSKCRTSEYNVFGMSYKKYGKLILHRLISYLEPKHAYLALWPDRLHAKPPVRRNRHYQ